MIAVIASIIVALIASVGTYLVARRKNSGKIDTTEAAVLWQESQAMRQELRNEVVSLNSKLSEAQSQVSDLKEQLVEARSEISTLRRRVVELEKA